MIKKTLLATAVSLSLLNGTLVSTDGFARGGKVGNGRGQVERMTLFERLDSNNDSVFTIDEFPTGNADKAGRRFNYKDIDGDGALSLEEFSATSDRRGHGVPDYLDEDALELCMEELLGYELPDRPDSATAFDEADTDDSGSVDLDEFLAAGELRAEERFAEIDGGADGETTGDEIEAYQALRQERREARRTCVAEQLDNSDTTTDTGDTNTTLTYAIADTGQGTCYDNSELIDCPAEGEAFYGQDAQYTGNEPSYTDNGDGTITDNVTGLVWTQDLSDASMPWSDASDYCESLTLGITDWRLPNVKELWSIRDFSTGWPWVDTDYFYLVGDGSQGAQQHSWSSNYYLVDTDEAVENVAFIVNDWTGHIKALDGNRFVRCVSGDDYGINDFVDNGDGTITDNATGLMWMQDDSGYAMNWEAALAYAEASTYAGYDDWRLPSVKELQSLADYSGVFPAMDSTVFNLTGITNEAGNADFPYYWTGTTNPYIDEREQSDDPGYWYAWYFASGYAVDGAGEDTHGAGAVRFDTKLVEGPDGIDAERGDNYVRLVRGGSVSETPDGDPSAYRGDDETRLVVFPDGDTGDVGGDAGGPPDFAAAAEQLAVTEEALIAALGDPNQGEPDYEAAAATLGVTVEELEAALMENSGPTE